MKLLQRICAVLTILCAVIIIVVNGPERAYISWIWAIVIVANVIILILSLRGKKE